MSKIYFSGSMRGGRADGDLYRQIIGYLKKTGTVLTEYVGDEDSKSFEKEHQLTDEEIYKYDMDLLSQCDCVVAECTVPSLGVGYELCYAEKLGKPVYIFYRPEKTELSAMLNGDPYYHIYPYDTWDELQNKLEEVIGNV